MDLDAVKERLRAEEQATSSRLERLSDAARDPGDDSVRDSGDESLFSTNREDRLREAEGDRTRLEQIRGALARVEAGTYGMCVVDGEAIEEARLEAVPWTPFCLKHQETQEDANPSRGTSL